MHPINGPASVSPIVVCHTRIVPSEVPEAMRWPSGENATDVNEDACPVNGPASFSPVVVFHTQIAPSREPEAMRWPFGENATDVTVATQRLWGCSDTPNDS